MFSLSGAARNGAFRFLLDEAIPDRPTETPILWKAR